MDSTPFEVLEPPTPDHGVLARQTDGRNDAIERVNSFNFDELMPTTLICDSYGRIPSNWVL